MSSAVRLVLFLSALAFMTGCGKTDRLVGDAVDVDPDGLVEIATDSSDAPFDSSPEPFIDTVDVMPDTGVDIPPEVHTWARTYGGSHDENVRAVYESEDGRILIAGYTRSFDVEDRNMWIVSLDDRGSIIWEKTYARDLWNYATILAPAGAGGWLTGGGGVGEVILRLDTDGEVLWRWQITDPEAEDIASVVRTYEGNFAACLIYGYNVGFLLIGDDGAMVERKYYPDDPDGDYQYPGSIIAVSEGGFLIVGRYGYRPGWPGTDGFAMRIGADGDLIWIRKYRSERWEQITRVAENPGGGFVAVGWTAPSAMDPTDTWIVRFDSDGVLEWQKILGMGVGSVLTSVVATGDGEYVAAGYLFSEEWNRILLVKFAHDGAVIWAKTYGNSDMSTTTYTLAKTRDGGFVIAGVVEGIGTGAVDAWVLKTNANGDIEGDCPAGMISDIDAVITDSDAWMEETPVHAAELALAVESGGSDDSPTSAVVEQQCP